MKGVQRGSMTTVTMLGRYPWEGLTDYELDIRDAYGQYIIRLVQLPGAMSPRYQLSGVFVRSAGFTLPNVR
jgi:hypothetical protein